MYCPHPPKPKLQGSSTKNDSESQSELFYTHYTIRNPLHPWKQTILQQPVSYTITSIKNVSSHDDIQFRFYWYKGTNNDVDYFTNHHATKYHRIMINRYIQDLVVFFIQCKTLPSFPAPSVLRGCVVQPMRSQWRSHMYNTLDLGTSSMTCTPYIIVWYTPIHRGNSQDAYAYHSRWLSLLDYGIIL